MAAAAGGGAAPDSETWSTVTACSAFLVAVADADYVRAKSICAKVLEKEPGHPIMLKYRPMLNEAIKLTKKGLLKNGVAVTSDDSSSDSDSSEDYSSEEEERRKKTRKTRVPPEPPGGAVAAGAARNAIASLKAPAKP